MMQVEGCHACVEAVGNHSSATILPSNAGFELGVLNGIAYWIPVSELATGVQNWIQVSSWAPIRAPRAHPEYA